MRDLRLVSVGVVGIVVAIGCGAPAPATPDGGRPLLDAGRDGGARDAGGGDGGPVDASPMRDGGATDGGPLDARVDAPPAIDAGPPPCGNGAIDPGEACDDGNTVSGDGCRGDCRGSEECGDGLADFGEWCLPRTVRMTPFTGLASGSMVGDADGDGDVDVYLLIETSLQLFRNDGTGTLAAPVAAGGQLGLLVQLDAMRGPEIVGQLGAGIGVYPNDGSGVFGAPATYGTVGRVPAAADLDGDGDMDVVGSSFGSTSIVVFENRAGVLVEGAAFTVPAEARQLLLGDVDDDGAIDAVTLHDLGFDNVAVLRGDGARGFAPATIVSAGFPTSGSLGDVDGDGDLDVAIAVQMLPQRVEILRMGPMATPIVPASRLMTSAIPLRAELVDVNLDGFPELFAAGVSAGTPFSTLYLGDASGAYGTVLEADFTGGHFVDMNGDGAIDLVRTSGAAIEIHLAVP